MKNLFKKNQLMITALALMIAVAGYLQFTSKKLPEEEYIKTNAEGQVNDTYTLDSLLDVTEEEIGEDGLIKMDSLDADMDMLEGEEGLLTESVNATGLETPDVGETPGEAVFTGTTSVNVLSEAKLLKEQVRAKNKATLMEIVNSSTLSDEQKKEAVDSMVKMTDIAEKELAAEILLEAKGFPGVVVSISDTGVDVVVNLTSLPDDKRAQIEDIVKRKTGVASENIIISTVVQE